MNKGYFVRYLTEYTLVFILFTVASSIFISCSDGIAEDQDAYKNHLQITQNHLPTGKEEYKILAIGNSYTIDGTAYIEDILDKANIDRNNYCVYTITEGSTSLKYWSRQLYTSEKIKATRVAGSINEIADSEASLGDVIKHDWDVIVLQQFSQESIDYNTYNPYLTNILSYIQTNCPNKAVAIAWQIIPAYSKSSQQNKGIADVERWKRNIKATKTMMQKDGIHIIIPTGTAIQLARKSNLENAYDLTRDHIHLCYGAGRYIAACTWIESLFGPVFGITIEGNTANHLITDNENNDPESSFIRDSSVEVNDLNRGMCQEMALRAFRNMFELDK